jgi:hypothetical protein
MLTLTQLNETFKKAVEDNFKYILVRIVIGLSREEFVINPSENFEEKQAYYNHAYNEDLHHKFAGDDDIRITGFVYGDSFRELEDRLEIYTLTGSSLN